jgi:hypothetical protein
MSFPGGGETGETGGKEYNRGDRRERQGHKKGERKWGERTVNGEM